MKKLLISSVGLLAALTVLGPAFAADLKVEPRRERATQSAQTQQSSNWNGGQVGGSNGASGVNNNFVEPGAHNFGTCVPGAGGAFFFGTTPCLETPFSFSGHKTSWIGGGFLGYRWQFGGMVFGVETDVYYKNGESSFAQSSRTPYSTFDYFTGSQKQGWDGSLRARWGVLVTPFTLVYVTGGLAYGQVSGSFSYLGSTCASQPCPGGNVFGAATWNDTRVGGTFGGGVEWLVASFWTVRVEYRYTSLGSFSKDIPLANNFVGGCGGTCGVNAHIDLKASDNRVTFGVAYNFGP